MESMKMETCHMAEHYRESASKVEDVWQEMHCVTVDDGHCKRYRAMGPESTWTWFYPGSPVGHTYR